jgi:hypothetical protein
MPVPGVSYRRAVSAPQVSFCRIVLTMPAGACTVERLWLRKAAAMTDLLLSREGESSSRAAVTDFPLLPSSR